jgi:hypothetical protein
MRPAGACLTTKADRRASHHGPARLHPVLPRQEDIANPESRLQDVRTNFFFNAVKYLGNAKHARDNHDRVDPAQKFGDPKGKPREAANHVNTNRRKE